MRSPSRHLFLSIIDDNNVSITQSEFASMCRSNFAVFSNKFNLNESGNWRWIRLDPSEGYVPLFYRLSRSEERRKSSFISRLNHRVSRWKSVSSAGESNSLVSEPKSHQKGQPITNDVGLRRRLFAVSLFAHKITSINLFVNSIIYSKTSFIKSFVLTNDKNRPLFFLPRAD